MVVPSQLFPCATQSRLDTLVDDVLIQILSLLPVWDVLHLRQTSKRMEALSHICAVWRALFARDVLTRGRPIPGFSFAPTPRLLQLCALDPSFEKFNHEEFVSDSYDLVRELIEASDLEARTLHALRLDKTWRTSSSPAATIPGTSNPDRTSESHLRTFHTPTPVRDIFLVPGGRLVVTMHGDRLRCWDLGVPHASDSDKLHGSLVAGVKCAGELVFSHALGDATMCMDARPGAASVSGNGHHKEYSISFALILNAALSWQSSEMAIGKRTCDIFSVRLDPLRSGSLASSVDVNGSPFGSPASSPFATPVPSFTLEGTVCLPEVLPTPSYPEGSVSAQTMVGEQWGPQRFSRGKLGKLLHLYGSVMFFESFVPPPPAEDERDVEEGRPKYVGIEVLDWNEPTTTILYEHPDPQVGPFVGLHVHGSAEQVLVVWQNCVALYPFPFLTSNLSSSSSSGSTSGSLSARSSRPSTPFRAAPVSIFPSPPSSLSTSPSTSPFCSSPGSPRSKSLRSVSGTGNIGKAGSTSDSGSEGEPVLVLEPRRSVTMPNIIFAMSEPIEAPIAFSSCDVDASGTGFTRTWDEKHGGDELGLPHPLTIVARSRIQPSRNVQSVLTASPNPQASATSGIEDKFTFHLSRIPAATPDTELDSVAAIVLGQSGRGVRADADGALFRCTRAEVVLPRVGFGFGYGFGSGGGMKASAVPTIDFWPWRSAAAIPLPPSSAGGESSNLVVRFDDGMGRVVAARVPRFFADANQVNTTSEVAVLDFA